MDKNPRQEAALFRFGRFVIGVKALLAIVAGLPAVIGVVIGFYEGRPTQEIIALLIWTLAGGLALTLLGIMLYYRSYLFLSGRREQRRISGELSSLGEIEDLDIPTAAGIWAGTLDSADAHRHVLFRSLKNATSKGHIRAANLKNGELPNVKTRLEIESLKDYWRARGVIR